jgi:hypothetical protein
MRQGVDRAKKCQRYRGPWTVELGLCSLVALSGPLSCSVGFFQTALSDSLNCFGRFSQRPIESWASKSTHHKAVTHSSSTFKHSTMVSPVEKSSFKEQERSKPKEMVVEPIPSQSVPLKEVTVKIGAGALALELRATKAIQREALAVLENGTSRPPLYLDHNG